MVAFSGKANPLNIRSRQLQGAGVATEQIREGNLGRLTLYLKENTFLLNQEELRALANTQNQSKPSTASLESLASPSGYGKAFFSISNDPVLPFLDANVYLV